jgi:predicted RNA-binding Zn-ribbon protein involved in translation (DUF1610 family)
VVRVSSDKKCQKCGNTAVNSAEYEKTKGESFEDMERNMDRYRPLYKCLSCGFITPGDWIPYTR